MADENSITFTMEEFGKFQEELLDLKHQNEVLTSTAQKYEELTKLSPDPYDEIMKLRETIHEKDCQLQSLKEVHAFSRQAAQKCLNTIRKQETYSAEEQLLIEQVFAITEHMWPKTNSQQTAELSEQVTKEIQYSFESTQFKEQTQKLKYSVESLEAKVQVLQQSLDETVKDNSELRNQLKELETQKENLIFDLASREEELNESRKALKDKNQVELQLHQAQAQVQSLNSTIENLNSEVTKLQAEETQQVQTQQLLTEKEHLKKELEELTNKEHILSLEYTNLKKSYNDMLEKLKKAEEKTKDSETQVHKLQESIKTLNLQVEDSKTEKKIIQKRSMHDIKDLKNELAKEKTAHETVKMEKEKLCQEIRRLQDLQRNVTKSSDSASLQEKAIVEALYQRVSELELENSKIKENFRSNEELSNELLREQKENQELREEINRLQTDIVTLGSQFNEMIRSGNIKR